MYRVTLTDSHGVSHVRAYEIEAFDIVDCIVDLRDMVIGSGNADIVKVEAEHFIPGEGE